MRPMISGNIYSLCCSMEIWVRNFSLYFCAAFACFVSFFPLTELFPSQPVTFFPPYVFSPFLRRGEVRELCGEVQLAISVKPPQLLRQVKSGLTRSGGEWSYKQGFSRKISILAKK